MREEEDRTGSSQSIILIPSEQGSEYHVRCLFFPLSLSLSRSASLACDVSIRFSPAALLPFSRSSSLTHPFGCRISRLPCIMMVPPHLDASIHFPSCACLLCRRTPRPACGHVVSAR